MFKAMIRTLNLDYADAATLLRNAAGAPFATATIQDFVRGKSRVPDDVWRQLSELFEAVEAAADDIIADQGEADGGEGLLRHTVLVDTIPLPHPALRAAAAARALFVLGPRLLDAVEQPRPVTVR